MDSSIRIIIFIVTILADLFLSACVFYFAASCSNLTDSDLEWENDTPHKKFRPGFLMLLEKYRSKTERLLADCAGFLAISSVVYFVASYFLFQEWRESDDVSLWIVKIGSFILLYFLYLLLGVFLPYTIGAEKPLKFLPFTGYIYRFFALLLTPFLSLEYNMANHMAGLFGVSFDMDGSDVTEEEILSMVHEGHEQGSILGSEAKMIQNILNFDDKIAKDIMIHRPDIVGMDGESTLQEAIRFVVENHYSRYPVYIEDLDHVIGLVHIKEILQFANHTELMKRKVRDIDGLLRPIEFVPETHGINTLFTTMQIEKSHMVMIVDEYGQASGLVAMEDILEEIVGNIEDEHDETEESIEAISKNSFMMNGATELEEVEESLQIQFPDEDIDTLNGFLITQIHRIPEEHEEFKVFYQGYCFHVLDVRQNVIQEIKVSLDSGSVETIDEK